MRRRIQQRLMLVLPVQLDQPVRTLLQRRSGDERPVDERSAPALRRDLTSNQELTACVYENRFDRRRLLAAAHEVPGGASTEQQPDRFDEDRLAGTGFAGQDVQSGVEFDLNRVDHREMADAEETEHGESARTPILT